MDSARLTYLFQRYTEQTCTAEETQELMQALANPANDTAIKTIIDQVWHDLPEHEKLPAQKAERILQHILPPEAQPLQRERQLTPLWTKVAAAVIVLMLAGTVFFQWNRIVRVASPTLADHAEPLPSEHQYIKLPDGSTVVLNAGSRLDYAASFDNAPTRDVVLHGEGYFDIRHDATKPFVVHTGKLKTTVLGTAFNIKAYETESNIIVTVTRGKVRVSDEQKTLGVITPNQQITFNKQAHSSAQQTVDSEAAIAWTARDIFFDDLTLQEATTQLSARFHVNIAFENARVGACRFTATFMNGEDLDQILHVICEFYGARYERDAKGAILIKGNGC